MKRVFGVILLVVFFVAFGVGFLLTVPTATACQCPCTNLGTCSLSCCPLGGHCNPATGCCTCFVE